MNILSSAEKLWYDNRIPIRHLKANSILWVRKFWKTESSSGVCRKDAAVLDSSDLWTRSPSFHPFEPQLIRFRM